MKGMRVNDWKTVWNKSSVERELNQILFESYANDFKKIFKKGDLVLEAGYGYSRYCFWPERSARFYKKTAFTRCTQIQGLPKLRPFGLQNKRKHKLSISEEGYREYIEP
jgi:hypothetical protein